MASEITLHVELMGQDRDLLERTCENLEWYRKHLQEQAMMQTEREREALKRGGSWETKEHDR
jgi:hypothetical protein